MTHIKSGEFIIEEFDIDAHRPDEILVRIFTIIGIDINSGRLHIARELGAQLIELQDRASSPLDRMMTFYVLDQINGAAEDSIQGRRSRRSCACPDDDIYLRKE